MSLRPAELKCYLVVTRAIQRDRNGGELSIRQIAKRARVGKRHAEDAIHVVVSRGPSGLRNSPGRDLDVLIAVQLEGRQPSTRRGTVSRKEACRLYPSWGDG
jgi:hypothetical protein